MDLLLKENFDLKREIVFERKKYVDLQQAYQDLQKNVQEGERPSVDSNQQFIEELKQNSSDNNRRAAGVPEERPSIRSNASHFSGSDPMQQVKLWKLEKNQM